MAPASVRKKLNWLFSALERAYPVSFPGADPSALRAHDASILFREEDAELPRPAGRCLVYELDAPGTARVQRVAFRDVEDVDRRLRGRTLEERSLALLRPLETAGGEVLAMAGGAAVWVRRRGPGGTTDHIRLPGTEGLMPPLLWDNLQNHRFFFLLTLVHHLYGVLNGSGWVPPPLRASFIIDDPNLRRPTYGFLRYPELAGAARSHRFHASIAVNALDLAATSSRMARFMAEHRDVLSLCVHGDDHSRRELMKPAGEDEAVALLSRMVRRIEAFEARWGIPVARVLVPPHDLCSPVVLHALARFPLDAVAVTRPFPWLPPDGWSAGLGEAEALAGWHMADFVAGGVPVIRRSAIPDNMIFRAFLNQPVIRYFHHPRFAGAMEVPLAAAREINAMGEVHWCSPGAIARTNYDAWVSGDGMLVRPFSRGIAVSIPESVTQLRVEAPSIWAGEEAEFWDEGGRSATLPDGEAAEVIPGSCVRVRFRHPHPVAYRRVRVAPTPVAAWMHRRLGEAMDRLRLRQR